MVQVTKEQFEQIIAASEAKELAMVAAMPTEQDAIDALFNTYQRLKQMGWKEMPGMAPLGTKSFLSITVGSTGQFVTLPMGERQSYFVEDGNDLWPATPILWKPLPAKEEK